MNAISPCCTPAAGEPLCCAMIIATTKMNALVPVGHQAWADIHGNGEGNFEANGNGDNKLYPFCPITCTY